MVLNQKRVDLETTYKEEIFYDESGETLEQVTQRRGRCPPPETFKDRLDGALSNLIQLLIAEGLD